jgi:gliding motility-associated-like protein
VRLCPDSNITIQNKLIDQSGSYDFDLQTKEGCDSLLRYEVTKLSTPMAPIIVIDCKKEVYQLSIPQDNTWQHQWSTGSNDLFIETNNAEVAIKYTTPDGCIKEYKNTLPIIPKLSDIPKLTDQVVKDNAFISVKVDVDPLQWKIKWLPSSLIDCDTCFTTTINTEIDTTIKVVLTHSTNCSFEQVFRILKENTSIISIPNVFKPDANSTNATWTINLPVGYTISEINVYDRWADKVFTSKNTSNVSWDGTFNGQAVLPGVYVYQMKIIDPKGGVVVRVGDVTVVR